MNVGDTVISGRNKFHGYGQEHYPSGYLNFFDWDVEYNQETAAR
jgi:hypothetical protein